MILTIPTEKSYGYESKLGTPQKKRWFIPTLPYRLVNSKNTWSFPMGHAHPPVIIRWDLRHLEEAPQAPGVPISALPLKKKGMLKADEKYLGFADLGSPQEITLIFTIDSIDSPGKWWIF